MSDISKSALGETFDAEFEAKVSACTSASEISELMKQRSIDMGLMKRDWDPDILIPTGREVQPQPQRYAKSIIVNGEKRILESDSEIGLSRAESELYRKLIAPNEPIPTAEPVAQPRNDRGQYVADDDAAKVDAVLRSHGVSLADLKDISAQKFATSWATATEEFKNSAAGRDWPGGAENLRLMGEILVEKKLADHPSVESLTEAYESLKRENRLVSTPESEFYERAKNAKSFSELTELTSELTSSLFGRR